ncbi:hypothetical protein [Gordonia humi]|uniref:Uncharacterized protein n=1 Tax=Gordonia humi TaxID=686429 RepID=A0A840EYI8_9ACTN|nr:hypothetical protein [Gordonia humi]MBB4138155.1 hypothetical protein [Gordonia humi]
MTVERKPAISRITKHPAEDLPERPGAEPARSAPGHQEPMRPYSTAEVPSDGGGEVERFSDQLNTKMRPSTRRALGEAIIVHEYRSGSKASIQSVIDAAILEYIDKHDLKRG